MTGSLIIVSGQSGTGKTTIVEQAIARTGIGKRIITCTSRAPRGTEIDGIDYHFLPRIMFEEFIRSAEFAEYADVYGNLYGTLKRDIIQTQELYPVAYLITDVQGAETLLEKYPHAHSIFITLPSVRDLEERLRKRGDKEAAIIKRLSAFEEEQKRSTIFDSIIINKNGELKNSIAQFMTQIRSYCALDSAKHGR